MSTRDLSWLTREKQDISKRNTYIRLLIPPILAVIFFIMCFLILPRDRLLILGGLMIAYFIPPSGMESIIPIGIGLGIPWWLMALTLTLLDVITALFMIMKFALMLRVPRLGPWIEKTNATGREFMAERPWMARWRIPGVAFFVMLPLQGTGGVGATVVGLMAGLTPGEILLAVGIGAPVESLAFALGHLLAQPFHDILNALGLLSGEISGAFIPNRPFQVGVSGFNIKRGYQNRCSASRSAQGPLIGEVLARLIKDLSSIPQRIQVPSARIQRMHPFSPTPRTSS